jgi:hypothetical protein
MFQQLKENARLADKLKQASELPHEARQSWKSASQVEKGTWLSFVGLILIDAVANHYSIVWYKRLALIVVLVMLPFAIWTRIARSKNSR